MSGDMSEDDCKFSRGEFPFQASGSQAPRVKTRLLQRIPVGNHQQFVRPSAPWLIRPAYHREIGREATANYDEGDCWARAYHREIGREATATSASATSEK